MTFAEVWRVFYSFLLSLWLNWMVYLCTVVATAVIFGILPGLSSPWIFNQSIECKDLVTQGGPYVTQIIIICINITMYKYVNIYVLIQPWNNLSKFLNWYEFICNKHKMNKKVELIGKQECVSVTNNNKEWRIQIFQEKSKFSQMISLEHFPQLY